MCENDPREHPPLRPRPNLNSLWHEYLATLPPTTPLLDLTHLPRVGVIRIDSLERRG